MRAAVGKGHLVTPLSGVRRERIKRTSMTSDKKRYKKEKCVWRSVSPTALALYIFNIQNYIVNNLLKNIPVLQPFHRLFAILELVVGHLFLCDCYQSLRA